MEQNQPYFSKPVDLSVTNDVFGCRSSDMTILLPAYKDIPDEFKRQSNPWVQWQQKWFFSGLEEKDIPTVKEGIDAKMALRHLASIQQSFLPKHEHKEAGVAFLASLWFEPLKS